jgi:osmotically-inducible protein OsmY
MRRTSAKVFALITCLSALPLIVGLTGCASGHYNQSKGRSIDDKRTAEPEYSQSTDQGIEDKRTAGRVREALAAVPQYKFEGVQVAAGNGVVQLRGFVNTSPQRSTAGEVASKVAGVKDVVNNITVKE